MQVEKPFVLIVNGSPHLGGQTDFLTTMVCEGVSSVPGVDHQVLFLRDAQLPEFDGTLSRDAQLGCEAVVGMVRRASGIIVVSPTYWFAPSSLVKKFIELITCLDEDDYALAGKVGGVLTCCEEDGASAACMYLVYTLVMKGFTVPGHCGYFYNKGSAPTSENNWQNTDHQLVGKIVAEHIVILGE